MFEQEDAWLFAELSPAPWAEEEAEPMLCEDCGKAEEECECSTPAG